MHEQEDSKDTKPDVDPREVAKAIEEIKLRFGNVDENCAPPSPPPPTRAPAG